VFEVDKLVQITNNTAQNVLVEITGLAKELEESSPTRQIVPPGQVAVFDIILFVTDPIELAASFQYIVNSFTTYSVNVIAKVVPVEIELSRATIDFQFGKTTTDNFVIEKLKLKNRSDTIAKYRWEGFERIFSIASTEGQIGPKQEAWIDIVYKPDHNAHVEQLVTLCVIGGVPKTKCVVVVIPGPGAPCYILPGAGKCLRICVVPLSSRGARIARSLSGQREPQLKS
jgi:hypothetical protein